MSQSPFTFKFYISLQRRGTARQWLFGPVVTHSKSLIVICAVALIPQVVGCSRTVPVTAAEGSTPKVGERAPGFSLPTATGGTVSLDDWRGKSGLILAFYRGYW